MKFFAIAALATVALAQYPAGTPAEETCSQVTVTITSTLAHVPSAPGAHNPSSAPYPTTAVPKPTAPVMGGTGMPSVPAVPVGTGYPVVPSGSGGVAKPTGTGAYSAPPSQFTGAASSLKVGGALVAGAFAAVFL